MVPKNSHCIHHATLNEAFDKARAAAMPEIPPPITITEGGEEFCPSMCLKKPPAAKPFGGWFIL
jgi:hypothetical protein